MLKIYVRWYAQLFIWSSKAELRLEIYSTVKSFVGIGIYLETSTGLKIFPCCIPKIELL